MSAPAVAVLAFASLAVVSNAPAPFDPAGGMFADAIDAARTRVVKVYGGALGRERGYGSGVVVSPDGVIVTTLSVLLDAPALRVVTFDGQRYRARVTARSEPLQLARLKIEAEDLPCFQPGSSEHLRPGDWVIAAANAFKVADGPEPVSVTVGVFTGRADLQARRRRQDFPYEGPVLLTDVIVSSPGSAGGALLDADGRLVGVIGKAVVSERTNTLANYALPVEQVVEFLQTADAPQPAVRNVGEDAADGARIAAALGIRLFDISGPDAPAYVERVRPGSPAFAAGLRSGDLILAVNERPIESCSDFTEALDALEPEAPALLLLKRGESVLDVELRLEDSVP